jgi:hypothetical protein
MPQLRHPHLLLEVSKLSSCPLPSKDFYRWSDEQVSDQDNLFSSSVASASQCLSHCGPWSHPGPYHSKEPHSWILKIPHGHTLPVLTSEHYQSIHGLWTLTPQPHSFLFLWHSSRLGFPFSSCSVSMVHLASEFETWLCSQCPPLRKPQILDQPNYCHQWIQLEKTYRILYIHGAINKSIASSSPEFSNLPPGSECSSIYSNQLALRSSEHFSLQC